MAVTYLGGLTRARSNVGSTIQRLRAYPIQNGHQSAMYSGTPVKISTASGAGTLDVATNTAAVVGVALSFHWVDKTTGQPQYSKFFPAQTSNKNSIYNEGYTTPWALVDDNPHGTWTIATETSVSAGNIGSLARVTNAGSGSATTGRSSCKLDLSGTAVSAGNAMFRIVGLKKIISDQVSTAGANTVVGDLVNDWDAASTIVEVVFQNHQYG